ncbi:MAG TPA: hypothetical protein VFI31_07050 [Pirellulales bacterium]|nr:hypothetical protein [Pirellulales bacterium]
MTRFKLHYCYGMLLAAAFAVVVGQGKAPRHCAANLSGGDCHVAFGATTAPVDRRHVECGRTSPFMSAAACEDTDDDEISDREPASQPLSPLASPSRRATRMASSVRQQTLNTLNALCVRLQI